MQRVLTGIIAIYILFILLTGCSSVPAVQDNRADEQRANAAKAHKELGQEVSQEK